jgi:hypothetical protein
MLSMPSVNSAACEMVNAAARREKNRLRPIHALSGEREFRVASARATASNPGAVRIRFGKTAAGDALMRIGQAMHDVLADEPDGRR